MDKRCLIVTYYFPPMGGGGVQRITKLIKYAGRASWNFTVITAEEKSSTLPSDNSLLNDLPQDLPIIRVPGLIKTSLAITSKRELFTKSTFWKRWLSALRYIPDMRLPWIPLAKEVICNQLKKEKYDCILVTSPPYSLAVLASELQQVQSVPVILDMRDPWTTNPYKLHPTRFHLKKDRALEIHTIQKINWGISAYKNLVEYYKAIIPEFNIQNWITIPNGFDDEDFTFKEVRNPVSSELSVGFSGTFYSHINNPTPLFKALALVKKNIKSTGKTIRFYHIGSSNIDLRKLAKKYGLIDDVVQLGYLSHSETLKKLQDMDALVFILDDRNKHSQNTIGGKVYEYIRLKKPILALVPEQGEAADLIRHTASGAVVSPQKTQKIAELLKEWAIKLPRFNFKNVDQYSRVPQALQFIKMFEKTVSD